MLLLPVERMAAAYQTAMSAFLGAEHTGWWHAPMLSSLPGAVDWVYPLTQGLMEAAHLEVKRVHDAKRLSAGAGTAESQAAEDPGFAAAEDPVGVNLGHAMVHHNPDHLTWGAPQFQHTWQNAAAAQQGDQPTPSLVPTLPPLPRHEPQLSSVLLQLEWPIFLYLPCSQHSLPFSAPPPSACGPFPVVPYCQCGPLLQLTLVHLPPIVPPPLAPHHNQG